MGLFRYLRRKLNTQQLKEISETVSSKAVQALEGQQELKRRSDQIIAGHHNLGRKAELVMDSQQQLKKAIDVLSSKAGQTFLEQQRFNEELTGTALKADQGLNRLQQLKETGAVISSKADVAIQKLQELGKKTNETLEVQQQLKEAVDAISSKAEEAAQEQQLLNEEFSGTAPKVDQGLESLLQMLETCAGIMSKADQAVQKQQELIKKADQALAGHQELKEKADQTIADQQELGKKSDQVIALQQELKKKADQAISSQQDFGKKADQALSGQQELMKKADQAAASQQELGKKSDQVIALQQELKKKADQAISSQQDFGKKADQALSGQQELKKKADQAAAAQQDLGKKLDQAVSGQKQLAERGGALQAKLDQLAASQKQCANEIEFARMSRTLFAGFRYWEDNFYNAIKGTDIEEKYDRLVSGLSDEERTKVDTIIGRIQRLCEKGEKTCYLPDEAERIYRNRKESLRIVKLNDHCFVYRNFKLPLMQFETSTFACNYGLELIDHPQYADGKDIIDAGAYIGDSALVLDRFFPKCQRIYAFEPDPKSYGLMEKTIAMNKKTNIIPVGFALGDANSEGILTSHDMGANLVNRQFGNETEQDRKVRIVRLDDYVNENDIVTGVIKTDLEGFEMHFLRGAIDTIKKHRPIMVLSIYHSAEDFFGIKPFIDSLDLGYSFRFFKADDGMILGGTCLICIPE